MPFHIFLTIGQGLLSYYRRVFVRGFCHGDLCPGGLCPWGLMSCTRTSTAPPRLMRDSSRFQLSECPPLWCHDPRSVRTHVSIIRPYLCSYLDQLDDNTHNTAIKHLFNNNYSLISMHIYFMSKLPNEANSTIRKCSHDMLPEPI